MEKQNARFLQQSIAAIAAAVLMVSFSIFAMAQRENAAAIFATAPRVQTSVKGVTTFCGPAQGLQSLDRDQR